MQLALEETNKFPARLWDHGGRKGTPKLRFKGLQLPKCCPASRFLTAYLQVGGRISCYRDFCRRPFLTIPPLRPSPPLCSSNEVVDRPESTRECAVVARG